MFLHLISGVFGVLFLYVAVFLYEDEERRLHSKLEDWWLRLAEMQRQSTDKEAHLLQVAAQGASDLLARIFGPRTISMRAVLPSIALSLASLEAFQLVMGTEAIPQTWLWTVAFIVLLLLPLAVPEPRFPLYIAGFAVVFAVYFVAVGHHAWSFATGNPNYIDSTLYQEFASGLATILVTCGINFLFLLAVRILLQWVPKRSRFVILLTAGVLFVFSVALTAGPVLGAFTVSSMRLGMMLISLGSANLYTIPVALLFFFTAAVLFLHRLLWPLLIRAAYPLIRYNLLRNKKLLAAAGVLLLSVAHPRIGAIARAGFELLQGKVPTVD